MFDNFEKLGKDVLAEMKKQTALLEEIKQAIVLAHREDRWLMNKMGIKYDDDD